MFVSHTPRTKSAISGIFLVVAFVYFTFQWRNVPQLPESWTKFVSTGAKTTDSIDQDLGVVDFQRQVDFWRRFQPVMLANSPDVPEIERDGSAPTKGANMNNEIDRPNNLNLSVEAEARMKQSHTTFVQSITKEDPKMVYVPGTRGIVTTAGGDYLPIMVSSLRMIRKSGSTLPVEVFLGSNAEYESFICDWVLPSLNAKCVVLSDILDSLPTGPEIKHYQYKVFAMLFSSFEELLFLDADAFPIHNPDPQFDSEPYLSSNLVLWPDFWASSASPKYYNIANRPIPPMTARASSETGEILFSKKTHASSLLLASYYNYYGPSHYYRLLSQGAPGEGDKETFLAAAQALNETYYTVSEKIKPIGHRSNSGGGIAGSAMVQYDPREDWALTSKGLWRSKDESVAAPPRVLFIHANFPKFNPGKIFKGPDSLTQDGEGKDRRAWIIPEDIVRDFGYDVERSYWEEIKWTACELEDKFKSWEGKKDVCNNMRGYWARMYGSFGEWEGKETGDPGKVVGHARRRLS
ncbi:hypothetical protein MMC09_004148 [Bachmanniomyces sp. S44760]|nr:hypothetical protein [Bachmanniomyces sp. S44760]